jgi:hypothetical protein
LFFLSTWPLIGRHFEFDFGTFFFFSRAAEAHSTIIFFLPGGLLRLICARINLSVSPFLCISVASGGNKSFYLIVLSYCAFILLVPRVCNESCLFGFVTRFHSPVSVLSVIGIGVG